MANLELPFGVKVINPKPLDAYYYNSSDAPWASVAAVNTGIPSAVRYEGLTVNINNDEYWYKDGITDIDLIQKTNDGDLSYTHNQGIAAQTWDIGHNLGKRPSIHVEDMSGNEIKPQIIYVDDNNAQAVFGNATYSGTAYCN